MTRRLMLAALAWLGIAIFAGPAAAQAPSPALRAAAEQVVALLKGEAEATVVFAPVFLESVPAAQVQAIGQQLRTQHGAPVRLAGIEASSATTGTMHVEMERATLHMNLAIEAEPAHRVIGLLVTGADIRAEAPDAIGAAIAALPGQTAFAIARLGDGEPELVIGRDPDGPLAIGSAFKLFILAELSRQVRAGERRWTDVVTLERASMPGGTLYAWPQGSPLTLHSLAALMISQSDNTATDVLLHLAGRENVERMMTTIGVRAADRNRPMLSTLELGTIKSAPDAAVAAWRAAGEAERRRLLASEYAGADASRIDPRRFTGAPLHIDSIEWFASPADLVRTMDWLRRNGDDTARAILAINPGAGPAVTRGLGFVGYKGGSEPGVLNLTWLVRNSAGVWHVVTGTWNNPAAALEEARFVGLMHRALQLTK